MASSSSHQHASSQHTFPPPSRQPSVSTQHVHPPLRIYIGPSPSSTGASSSHTRIPSSETDEPRQRKRDIVRRRRKRTNSGAEWGESSLTGGVRGWVGRTVGGESEERLLNQTADDQDGDDDQGLAWYRIKWEGEPRSGSRSRENTAEGGGQHSAGGGTGEDELNTSGPPPTSLPAHALAATRDGDFLSQGLTSSPLNTPGLPHPSGPTLELAPGPRRRTSPSQPQHPSAFAVTDAALAPSFSPLRPPPITKNSNVSSVMESFVTAQSSIAGDSTTSLTNATPTTTGDLITTASPPPDSSSSRTVTPPHSTRTVPLPSQPLPRFEHTPASPISSTAAGVNVSPPPTHGSPPPAARHTEPPAPLRSAIKGAAVPAPKRQQTVHFPLTPVGSGIFPSLGKGKGRAVAEEPESAGDQEEVEDVLEGDAEPADPSVVLGRKGAPAPGEAGNDEEMEQEDDDEPDMGPRDVILRDRILVRVQYSRSAGLPNDYDEWAQRRVPADRSEPWEEKLVMLRRGVVEIWEDWTVPLREKLIGRKKLAHVIPLDPKSTALSLYSHTDLTFCLATPFASVSSTAQRSSTKPSRLKHSRPGTAIFIFNLKTRTRATDWMWEIYLLLKTSSALPRFLDIHVPDLNNARIRIKVPVVGETRGVDSTEAVVRAMTRKKILQQSVEVLKELEGWKRLMGEMGVAEGQEGDWEAVEKKVALAWRKRDRLDWVWMDLDVTGHRREWNVLVGSGPLKQMRMPSVLELRLARHNNAALRLKSGLRVNEPAAVEGYLTRIKPKTQARATIYVSTHDGNLFVSSTHKAHQAPPPVSATPTSSPTAAAFPAASSPTSKSIAPTSAAKSTKSAKAPPATLEEFKEAERSRSTLQILNSSGLVDLRDIRDIRRVGRTPRPSGPAGGHDAEESAEAGGSSGAGEGPGAEGEDWESLDEDEEDEGGEEALKAGKSRGEATSMSDLRRKRTFEIELTNGEVQTFEAHSRLVAREWVDRLNALRAFWRAKHDRSAIQEMEVSHSKHIHTSDIVNGRRQLSDDDDDERESDEEDTRDPDEPPPCLEDMWNWCAIDACRVITKAGKLFSKRGNRQYRSKYTILIGGHLLQFSLHVNKPFHVRSHRISLLDAYVYSGLLAQDALPTSSNENALRHESRRYADGLQTSDGAEDTCLVIMYRPHPSSSTSSASKLLYHPRPSDATYTPPALGGKGFERLVLRARSKLERDAWSWCIGLEMERLGRGRKEREGRARGDGGVGK